MHSLEDPAAAPPAGFALWQLGFRPFYLPVLAADLLCASAALSCAVLLVAGCAHAARRAFWKPWRTLRVPLVWVLQLAYAWAPSTCCCVRPPLRA